MVKGQLALVEMSECEVGSYLDSQDRPTMFWYGMPHHSGNGETWQYGNEMVILGLTCYTLEQRMTCINKLILA